MSVVPLIQDPYCPNYNYGVGQPWNVVSPLAQHWGAARGVYNPTFGTFGGLGTAGIASGLGTVGLGGLGSVGSFGGLGSFSRGKKYVEPWVRNEFRDPFLRYGSSFIDEPSLELLTKEELIGEGVDPMTRDLMTPFMLEGGRIYPMNMTGMSMGYTREGDMNLQIDCSGYDPDEVKVDVQGKLIVIRSEPKSEINKKDFVRFFDYGGRPQVRMIRMPMHVNMADITCELNKQHQLLLRVPKAMPTMCERMPLQIAIAKN